MNILLIATRDIILISLFLLGVIIIVFGLTAKKDMNLEKKNQSASSKTGSSLISENTNLKMREHYLKSKEIVVYDLLQKNFGANYLVLPKVYLKDIVLPKASRVFYDLISEKVLDFVLFDKATLFPALVVDVFENTFGDESLKEVEKNVVTALQSVHLGLVSIPLREMSVLEETLVGLVGPMLEARKNVWNSRNLSSKGSSGSGGGTLIKSAESLKQTNSESDMLKKADGTLTNAGSLKK